MEAPLIVTVKPRARALTRIQRTIIACRIGRGDKPKQIADDMLIMPQRVYSVVGQLREIDPSLVKPKREPAAKPKPAPSSARQPRPDTIGGLCDAIERWAAGYYGASHEKKNVHYSVEPLRVLARDKPLEHLTAELVYDARTWLIAKGLSRRSVNDRVKRLKRVMRWAASVPQRWIPTTTIQEINLIEPLKRGRSEAPERPPVMPIDWATVEKTVAQLNRIPAAAVLFMWYTGCRPGEAVLLRPCDIDTTDPAGWVYRPTTHKTAHYGHRRAIAIGPQCREVLQPLIDITEPDGYVFDPKKADLDMRQLRAVKGKHRRPDQKPNPVKTARKIGQHYTTFSLGYAVRRAALAAGLKPWGINRLRHAAATRVLAETQDIDKARAVLGHTSAVMTAVYAEPDTKLAQAVMAKLG